MNEKFKNDYLKLFTSFSTSHLINATANTLQRDSYLNAAPLKDLFQEFVKKPSNVLILASLAQFAAAIPQFILADQIVDPITSSVTKGASFLLAASGIKTLGTAAKLRSVYKKMSKRELVNADEREKLVDRRMSPQAEEAFTRVKANTVFVNSLNDMYLLYGGFSNGPGVALPAIIGYIPQQNIEHKTCLDIQIILMLIDDNLKNAGIAGSDVRKEVLKQIEYDYFTLQGRREFLEEEHRLFLEELGNDPGYLILKDSSPATNTIYTPLKKTKVQLVKESSKHKVEGKPFVNLFKLKNVKKPEDPLQKIFVYGHQINDEEFRFASAARYWLLNNPIASQNIADILQQLKNIFDTKEYVKLDNSEEPLYSNSNQRLIIEWDKISSAGKREIATKNIARMPEILRRVKEVIDAAKIIETGNQNFTFKMLSEVELEVLRCALIRDFCFPPGEEPFFPSELQRLVGGR